ncbi:MAG: amidohydrolase family protein [Bacteroidales bacterium]
MKRKIAAHYLFTGKDKPLKNGIVTVDVTGKVLEVAQPSGLIDSIAGLEFYNGILVPGFVNTHCHLEFSHLKSIIPEHTGLPGFISQIGKLRHIAEPELIKASQKADIDMFYEGIVAVADISNYNTSFGIKSKSKIKYHTLIEIFSLYPWLANEKFREAQKLQEELSALNLTSSIVPHAPYSVTPEMFELIKNHSANQVISMHNQETISENDFYRVQKGELAELFISIGLDLTGIKISGKNSLCSVMEYLHPHTKTLLVHNTYTTKEDIEKASSYFSELYWTFCPNANRYIENKLPDIPLFLEMGQKITLGTDSLASNHKLSVLEEMKTIQSAFPAIDLENLITWATINGAEALGISENKGSIEPGKTPGINLISGLDLNQLKLKPESKVKRLI